MVTPQSAVFRDWSSSPTIAVVGDQYHILVSGKDSGGAYAMIGGIVPPGGGPPSHTHTREEEIFYVLEGEVSFFTEGKTVVGKPGTAVFLPRGKQHTFRNTGSQTAKILVHVVPAGIEEFFMEIGDPVIAGKPPGPPSAAHIKKIVEAAAKYGLVIAPPGAEGG